MGKLLTLVVLVVVAFWLIRKAFRAVNPPDPPQNKPIQQDLVRCARCGVHLPRSEARLADGQLYCSEEHARLGAGKG